MGTGHRPKDWWMLFPLQLLNCVVFLGERNKTRADIRGTGFLVSVPYRGPVMDGGERNHVFLFTARHCVEGRDGIVARVNRPFDPARLMDLPPGDDWYKYPTPPSPETVVDVAATLLSQEERRILMEAGYGWVPLGMFLPDGIASVEDWYAPPRMWMDQPSEGIGIGDEVVALGLLRVFAGSDRNKPVARTGNIAMQGHDVLRIRRRLGDGSKTEEMMRLYLTEVRSIQGESGSPVFVKLRRNLGEQNYQLALLGMLIGHWTDREDDDHFRENLGIGQVVPAFRLEGILQNDELGNELKKVELDDDDGIEAVADSALSAPDSVDATADLMGKLLQVPKDEADQIHRGHGQS